MLRLQPRRHAVDEGWDGDPSGFPDEGAPDGWSCEHSGLDGYARAEKALERARQAVLDQHERLQRVRLHMHAADVVALTLTADAPDGCRSTAALHSTMGAVGLLAL